MPDQQLLHLLGEDKRCIYRAVAWMLTGSLSSIGFTVCRCYGLPLLPTDARVSFFLLPFALGAVCAAVRFLATIRAAAMRDRLGCSVKKRLRAQLYAKLLRFGARETKPVKMAGFPLRSKWTSAEHLRFLRQNGWAEWKRAVLKASFPLTYTECMKTEV